VTPQPLAVRADTPAGPEAKPTPIREWRCERCEKLLSEYRVDGCLWERRKCPRCGAMNELEVCDRAA
jgi:phage FluMu protein Com